MPDVMTGSIAVPGKPLKIEMRKGKKRVGLRISHAVCSIGFNKFQKQHTCWELFSINKQHRGWIVHLPPHYCPPAEVELSLSLRVTYKLRVTFTETSLCQPFFSLFFHYRQQHLTPTRTLLSKTLYITPWKYINDKLSLIALCLCWPAQGLTAAGN